MMAASGTGRNWRRAIHWLLAPGWPFIALNRARCHDLIQPICHARGAFTGRINADRAPGGGGGRYHLSINRRIAAELQVNLLHVL
jgi:hypothetical protein